MAGKMVILFFPAVKKIVWNNKYNSLYKFHILGHIMLFALNGWHDLTKEDALHVLLWNNYHQNPPDSDTQ